MPKQVDKPVLKPAKPTYVAPWDPWNTNSTGHQRPENPSTTGWRNSRNQKLNSQFAAGCAGGGRLQDTWGAGSHLWDEKLKQIIPQDIRDRKDRSVLDMLVKPGMMKNHATITKSGNHLKPAAAAAALDHYRAEIESKPESAESMREETRKKEDEEREARKTERRIFDGLTIYINGSTFPLVSDHRLKQLLSENGAKTSIHLGRRKVTHVILGRSNGMGGAGGGLAGGKLQKEIGKIRGKGIKFVGVEWVLESIKAGIRLPETSYANTKITAKGQESVHGLFSKPEGSA